MNPDPISVACTRAILAYRRDHGDGPTHLRMSAANLYALREECGGFPFVPGQTRYMGALLVVGGEGEAPTPYRETE